MLSISVYRRLSELISRVHQVIDGVSAGVASTEVDLRADAARQTAEELKKMISHGHNHGPFADLSRHLAWLCKFYREEKPDRYAPDIRDIRDNDLPGVMNLVERWTSGS